MRGPLCASTTQQLPMAVLGLYFTDMVREPLHAGMVFSTYRQGKG
jgi:hypothetical protein